MRKAGIWAAAGALLASAWGAQAQTPRIVAFGDSLSDPGNLFIATGGTTPPNPYDQGRFSNGLTWVERLSGAPLNFFTFAAGRPGSVDFAFGGARTDTAVANPPGIPDQIASYLSRGGTFGSSDLVTLWGGANNIFQALAAPSPTLASLGAASTGGAGALAGSVQALAAAGARNIVVLNLPDLGLTPSFLNTAGQAGATYASAAFNQQLAASLAAVKAANPGVSIIQVDAKSIFDLVAASPGAFGFANSSAACLATPSCVAAPAAVQNGFAFWDGVHPTAAGHELIARLALAYLNAPVSAAGLSGMADVALMDRRDAAARAFGRFDRIRLGLQQPDGVYAEALGGRLEAGQDGGRPGYSSNRAGLAAGVTHAFTPNYAVGLEAYFTSGRYESGGYRSDLVVGGFDAVSSYTRGPFFARLGAGLGINRFGGLERATLGPLKNAASATGLSANVTAETGLSYKFGALDVSPRLRLGWLGANFDRFQEAGVVAPLDVRSRSVSALAGAAEVQFAYDLVAAPGRRIALLGTVGYERWFGVSGYQVEAELAGNTALPFAVRAAKPTGPGLLVGAGLAGALGETLQVSIDYRGAFGEASVRRHEGRVGVQYRF